MWDGWIRGNTVVRKESRHNLLQRFKIHLISSLINTTQNVVLPPNQNSTCGAAEFILHSEVHVHVRFTTALCNMVINELGLKTGGVILQVTIGMMTLCILDGIRVDVQIWCPSFIPAFSLALKICHHN